MTREAMPRAVCINGLGPPSSAQVQARLLTRVSGIDFISIAVDHTDQMSVDAAVHRVTELDPDIGVATSAGGYVLAKATLDRYADWADRGSDGRRRQLFFGASRLAAGDYAVDDPRHLSKSAHMDDPKAQAPAFFRGVPEAEAAIRSLPDTVPGLDVWIVAPEAGDSAVPGSVLWPLGAEYSPVHHLPVRKGPLEYAHVDHGVAIFHGLLKLGWKLRQQYRTQ